MSPCSALIDQALGATPRRGDVSGLVATVGPNGRPVDEGALVAMIQAGRHRGPDGIRTSRPNPAVALVQLVLAATDGCDGGPVETRNDIHVVADARLDNRPGLLRDLRGALAPINADDPTDAELIAAAYSHWGDALVDHLLGDFAFVLWDARRRRCVAARDAQGIKPLHYGWAGRTLVLASEAQQIVRHPGVSRRLDRIAMARHLANDCRDERRTMFEGIRAVPPAHILVAHEGTIRLRRFWEIDLDRQTRYRDDRDYAEHYRALLTIAVKARLRTSAAAVGLAMSGGLDSTSIAAVAQRCSLASPRVICASYAFDCFPQCDERAYSRLMASDLGLPVGYVNADHLPILSNADGFGPDPESPFQAARSARALLSHLGDSGARVLLTGHAGAWGMSGNGPAAYADRMLRGQVSVVAELRRHARISRSSFGRLAAVNLVEPLLPPGVSALAHRARGGLDPMVVPPWIPRSVARDAGLIPPQPRETKYRPRTIASRADALAATSPAEVGRAVYAYDRLSARYGMEARHPMLDRRLIEFLFSIPSEQIYRIGCDRRIAREAMRGLLPEAIRTRTSKTRFLAPFEESLRREWPGVRALFERSVLADLALIDGNRLLAAFDRFLKSKGETRNAAFLWFTLTAERWVRQAPFPDMT